MQYRVRRNWMRGMPSFQDLRKELAIRQLPITAVRKSWPRCLPSLHAR